MKAPGTRRAGARRVALALAACALAACGCNGGNVDTNKGAMNTSYKNQGDSGTAAPATQQTLSPNPSMGDSTVGMSRGTGRPGAAGDTAGAFGKAAGQHGAVPGKPTSGPAGSGMANTARGAPQSSTPATPKQP